MYKIENIFQFISNAKIYLFTYYFLIHLLI